MSFALAAVWVAWIFTGGMACGKKSQAVNIDKKPFWNRKGP